MPVGLQNAKSYPREFYLYENSNNDGVAKVVSERFVFFAESKNGQISALLASRKNFRVCFVPVDSWNFDLEESFTCMPFDNYKICYN